MSSRLAIKYYPTTLCIFGHLWNMYIQEVQKHVFTLQNKNNTVLVSYIFLLIDRIGNAMEGIDVRDLLTPTTIDHGQTATHMRDIHGSTNKQPPTSLPIPQSASVDRITQESMKSNIREILVYIHGRSANNEARARGHADDHQGGQTKTNTQVFIHTNPHIKIALYW